MSELGVRRLSGNIGAEVRGVSVDRVDETTMAELRRLVGQHVVLVFPGQALDPDAQIAFATRWGVPHRPPGSSGVLTLDSTERADGLSADEPRLMRRVTVRDPSIASGATERTA